MRHIATHVARSVVCVFVCVGHTGEPCKMAEPTDAVGVHMRHMANTTKPPCAAAMRPCVKLPGSID